MAKDASEVRVGFTGGAYCAPAGTTVPTNATTPIPAAFDDVGFLHEDGITIGINADNQDLKAWQGGAIVRKVQTSHDVTFNFKMMQTNDTTLKLFWADKTATATQVKITGAQSDHYAWTIEVIDGDDVIRIVLPDAQITERGEITIKNDEAIVYDVTLTAYPDANDVKGTIYLDSGAAGGE